MSKINKSNILMGLDKQSGYVGKGLSLILMCLMTSLPVQAALLDNSDTTLDAITYSTLPGDLVQIRLKLSGNVKEPGSFTIDNPARIALDFPKTKSNLTRKHKTIGVGAARSVTAVEAGGRTRVVINLTKLVSYQTKIEGNDVIVTLNAGGQAMAGTAATTPQAPSSTVGKAINNIDFRRGEKGERSHYCNLI